MKFLLIILSAGVVLAGCSYGRFQADVAENQYADKQIHAVSGAAYVGEWTASTKLGLRSIKILADGRAKVCLAGDGAGTTDGKVYLEKAKPALIFKSGAKVEILEANGDFLLLDIYGGQEKYYAGQVDESCQSAFVNFK